MGRIYTTQGITINQGSVILPYLYVNAAGTQGLNQSGEIQVQDNNGSAVLAVRLGTTTYFFNSDANSSTPGTITAALTTLAGTNSSASSYNTASVAPSANKINCLAVYSEHASGPNIPTVSGAAMTWDQVFTRKSASQNTKRITLFTASSSAPGTSVLVIDFNGQSQALATWALVELTSSSGLVQTRGADNSQSGNTGLTVTMNSFANANNGILGFCAWGGGAAITPGAGFTELGTTLAIVMWQAQFKNSADTSVDWSWTSATNSSLGAAVELQLS